MLVFTLLWDAPGKEKVANRSSAPASILKGFNEIYAVCGPKKPYKTRENRQSCQIDPCLPPYRVTIEGHNPPRGSERKFASQRALCGAFAGVLAGLCGGPREFSEVFRG